MDGRQKFVVGIFGALILISVIMVVIGDFLGPYSGSKLSDIGAESFKISVSALVGALSSMLGGRKPS
jgi:lipopolysaccharide export LptBFGC system permease protein LptF